jgi:hypothetical protein
MNIKDYIADKLNEGINLFPMIKFSYQEFSYSDTHYIKVDPSDSFYTSDDYAKWEHSAVIEFSKCYPGDMLCFLSTDAIIKIDNPEFVFVGSNYKQKIKISTLNEWLFHNIERYDIHVGNDLITQSPLQKTEITNFDYSCINNLIWYPNQAAEPESYYLSPHKENLSPWITYEYASMVFKSPVLQTNHPKYRIPVESSSEPIEVPDSWDSFNLKKEEYKTPMAA